MRHTVKKFLSDCQGESGSFVIEICSPRVKDYDEHSKAPWVSASLQITDCSKKVYLDFDIYEAKALPKRLDKLDNLINELVTMRMKLTECYTDAEKNFEDYQKLPKEEMTTFKYPFMLTNKDEA